MPCLHFQPILPVCLLFLSPLLLPLEVTALSSLPGLLHYAPTYLFIFYIISTPNEGLQLMIPKSRVSHYSI